LVHPHSIIIKYLLLIIKCFILSFWYFLLVSLTAFLVKKIEPRKQW